MDSKKGVIEIQFNWIFILVAGALILILFVVIVQRQGSVSNQSRDIDIRSKLGTILTGAKQSTDTTFVIDIPSKTEIDFGCNGYSVGGTSPFQLGESFSPGKIKSVSNNIILGSSDWSLPYKIANFQYITSPDIRYVIVSGSIYQGKLGEILPQNLTISIGDPSSVVDNNNYKIRYILISDKDGNGADTLPAISDNSIKKMKDEDVTAIHITVSKEGSDNPFDGYGEVEFYTKSGNSFPPASSPAQFGYIKKESLVGAIISDNNETYNCVMNRAFRQFNITTNLYLKKADQLKSLYSSGGAFEFQCNTPGDEYSNAVNLLTNMTTPDVTNSKIYDYAYKSETTGTSLKISNIELLKASCPLIY